MYIMEITDELINRTEELQSEMHEVINSVKYKHPFTNCSYADMTQTYQLMKIAELEKKIMVLDKLNNKVL